MAFKDVTEDGVRSAISEFDQLGEDGFFAKYGYGNAKSYYIQLNGKKYPSKAIFGVAHGLSGDGLELLKFDDFSGGEQQVAKPLRKLGFDVAGGEVRSPNWTRDELIIALSFYLDCDGNPPGKKSNAIIELSRKLNKLGRKLGIAGGEDFRNENGVYMKLMNFRRFDTKFLDQGKKGLTSGGKTEAAVWDEFADGPIRLRQVADTIISLIESDENILPGTIEADLDQYEASEGTLITRTHQARERSSAIVKKKKAQAFQETGRLVCEVCTFDFAATYGKRGEKFIECHHTKPVSDLKPGQVTKLTDLALLCANCHRMVHARRPWLTLDELAKSLRR